MTENTLIENPWSQYDDKADPLIPSATLQIYSFIGESLNGASKEVNRASAATMCPKRRWYQRRGETGTPLTPRKLINFTLGDLTELTLLYWIKQGCVGQGKLYSEVDFGERASEINLNGKLIEIYSQKTLSTEINDDLIITAHADGFGKRNMDGQWELIECKSSANYGYKDFRNGKEIDYMKQAHAVMASDECRNRGIDSVRFYFLRKETGNLWDRLEKFDPRIWETTKAEYLQVLSNSEIPSPYSLAPETTGWGKNKKETGRTVAAFPCSYCPYLKQCHGEFETEWSDEQWGSQKPKFIFKKKEELCPGAK